MVGEQTTSGDHKQKKRRFLLMGRCFLLTYFLIGAEVMENPDGYGKNTGDCGDTVEVFLSISDNRVKYISFNVEGCVNTFASANTVVRLAKGKLLEEAWEITPRQVMDYLETLPPDHEHCAELAAGALYLALSDFRSKERKKAKAFTPNAPLC